MIKVRPYFFYLVLKESVEIIGNCKGVIVRRKYSGAAAIQEVIHEVEQGFWRVGVL